MSAYYNEIDPYAAQWLRNLIAAGHIAPGDVDERSINDVRADDLAGYTQCHFFAGIGVWSHALRCAGWPDSRPVWTGSCPCQPFSVAGKGEGHEDERHLWPAWFWLIGESRPVVVFGEQVADGDGQAWLDHVGHDLESLDYALGAVCSAACGFGCPGERQRTYFVAHAERAGVRSKERGNPQREAAEVPGQVRQQRLRPDAGAGGASASGSVADPTGRGLGEQRGADSARDGRHPDGGIEAHGMGHPEHAGLEGHGRHGDRGEEPGRLDQDQAGSTTPTGGAGGLAHPQCHGGQEPLLQPNDGGPPAGERQADGHGGMGAPDGPGPLNGRWATADWLLCRDGKWRPVEPGTFPLVNGAPARMGRLRAYGNALNAGQAEEFIRAYDALT